MHGRKVAVSCHNCSRRRLRCDRSKPGCNKCTASGLDCPGYGRILTWVEGASAKAKRPRQRSNEAGAGAAGAAGAVSQPAGHTAAGSLIASGTNAALPISVRESRFGHVDDVTRLYMEHFENRVCKDLVSHDHPGSNPFRQLIPLALEHPFLLHILVATSALHLFNTLHRTALTIAQPHLLVASDTNHRLGIVTNSEGGPVDQLSKTALTNALAAKHRAICSLRTALAQPDDGNREVILAAILFFINFELIDVGNGGWQPHLRGAGRLMALLGQVQRSGSQMANGLLFDVVISDCLIYHILGSTLSPAWLTASITHQVLDLFPILERTEPYSYLCCPTALLKIILATSQLSVSVLGNPDPALLAEATASALALLNMALALDTHAWAAKLGQQQQQGGMNGSPKQPKPNPGTTDTDAGAASSSSREHVASAHRSAACLYILQAVPSARASGGVSSDELVADVLGHLGRVGPGDAHFKATSWPTFVAGAETRDPATRAWLLGRLLAVWRVCPWGYIFTAVGMLRRMWAVRDARTVGESDFGRVSGLRELWAMHLDCLVI